MKKQRKETRLKRKRLKAAYNTILEENRRLKGWQSVYGRKEIRTFGERKILTIFEAGSDNMGEIIKDRMAVEIGRALKENGAIQFETYDDPMNVELLWMRKLKSLCRRYITEPCRAVRKDEFSWLNTNYRIKRLS